MSPDVDHIVPGAVGGTDDAETRQALCWLCNTNKGAGDDATFGALGRAMRCGRRNALSAV